jgi:hypothetical protein
MHYSKQIIKLEAKTDNDCIINVIAEVELFFLVANLEPDSNCVLF